MTDETKNQLRIQLSMLKQTMKDNGVILALAVDHSDVNSSKICFIDKEQYLSERKTSGISVSLADFNKELMQEVI